MKNTTLRKPRQFSRAVPRLSPLSHCFRTKERGEGEEAIFAKHRQNAWPRHTAPFYALPTSKHYSHINGDMQRGAAQRIDNRQLSCEATPAKSATSLASMIYPRFASERIDGN